MGQKNASTQLVFLLGRDEWYYVKRKTQISQKCLLPCLFTYSLNSAVHYKKNHSKSPLACHNCSGLERSRKISDRLSSVVSAAQPFRAKHQNSPYKERKHQNSARCLDCKMKNVNHSPATFRMVNDKSVDLLKRHFDNLLHTLSHPAKVWVPPAMSRGPYAPCAELRTLQITQREVPRTNLILTNSSCREIALQSFACNKVINRS